MATQVIVVDEKNIEVNILPRAQVEVTISRSVGGGGGNGTPGGSNSQIQYNNNGGFSGVPELTYSNANGKITVANIGNFVIPGGSSGWVMTTDGNGNLSWAESQIEAIPYIHFNVANTGNNQQFTNNALVEYSNVANDVVLFRNGVYVEPTDYTLSGNLLTINIKLYQNDTLDIISKGGGGGGGTGTYSNSNVAAYLPVYGGNIAANVTGANTVSANTIIGRDVANGLTVIANSGVTVYSNTPGADIGLITANSQIIIEDTLGIDIESQFIDLFTTANGVIQIDTTASNSRFRINQLAWPNTPGSNGQVLTTNGTNAMSWTTAANSSMISNGTSNVSVAANGNITVGSNGVANVIRVSSNGVRGLVEINQDLSIGGNLSVFGNTSYINPQQLAIQDPVIEQGVAPNLVPLVAVDSLDRGAIFHHYGNGVRSLPTTLVPLGNTVIPLTSVTGFVNGQPLSGYIANGANIFPSTAVITSVNTSNNTITSNVGTLQQITTSDYVYGGRDLLRFIGWDTSNTEFVVASNVSLANDVVTINQVGNLRAYQLTTNFIQSADANNTSKIYMLASGIQIGVANGNTPGNTIFINSTGISSNRLEANILNITTSRPGNSNSTVTINNNNLSNINYTLTLPTSVANANAATLGTPTVSGGQITFIPILTAGDGYTSVPTVTITGTNTTPAIAVAELTNGVVSNINITNPGAGYNSVVATITAPRTKFLTSNNTGQLQFVEYPLVGGGGGGSGTPAGLSTQIQYNSLGAFAASGNLTFTDSNNTLTVGLTNQRVQITPSELQFYSNNGTAVNSVTIRSNNSPSTSGSYSLTLPQNDGNSGDFLQSDGSGILSWATPNRLVAGNSNVVVAANGNVTISSNGQGNIVRISSNGVAATTVVQNDVTVTGNLTVTGNTIYANVEVLTVEDPIIELGGGPNGAPLTTNDGKDRGIQLQYYTTQPVSAFMGWDNSNGEFVLGSNVTNTNEVIGINTLGNLRVGTVLGNLVGNFIGNISQISNGNSNVVVAANSNVTVSVGGISNIATITTTGATILGNLLLGGNLVANIVNSNAMIANVTTTGNLVIQYLDGNVANTRTITLVTGNGVANYTLQLPNSYGANGQVLTSYGNGLTYWGAGGNVVATSTIVDSTFTGVTATSGAVGTDEIITWTFSNDYAPTPASGGGGVTYTERTQPANRLWTSIEYGNGIIVSLAGTITINGSRSTDNGATWSNITLPNNSSGRPVYSNGAFIVGGGANARSFMTSTDGVTWTQRTTTTAFVAATWDLLCQVNSTLFMYGNTSVAQSGLFSSTDGGNNWTFRSSNSATGFAARAAATGNTIVISARQGTAGGSVIRSTDNGSTWSNVIISSGGASANSSWGVAYGSGLFVIPERDTNTYWTSNTGAFGDWTFRTFPYVLNGAVQDIGYAAGSFVVITSGGDILTSTNGTTWNRTTTPGAYPFVEVAYANTNWVSTVYNSNTAVTFNVGTAQTAYTITLPAHGSYSTQTITYTPTVGLTPTQLASSLGSQITTLRNTYTVSYPSSGIVRIDTNSSANIPDVTQLQTGAAPTGTLTFVVTQGSNASTATRDTVTLYDGTSMTSYIYSPAFGESITTIVNNIVAGETISPWLSVVQSANATQGTIRFTKTTTGYTAPSERISVSVVQGSGSTLAVQNITQNVGS